MHEWLLHLMLLCAPADAPLWRFDEIADAIHDASEGDAEHAAVLVALAAREGHFNPDAVAADHAGYSWGLYQIHESNFGWLGITWDDATSALSSSPIALRLVEESRRVCRARPEEERLAWYAAGGPTCDVPEGLADSRNRVALEKWLLRTSPAPTHFVESAETLRKAGR